MMSENLREAYTHHRWVKIVALVGLLLSGLLLMLSSGGFPPWAWRFLAQVISQFSGLWQAQGAAMLLPLIGLCLLSLSLFILWMLLVVLVWKVLGHIWKDYHAQQSFQDDLREAELLADQAVIEEIQPEYEDLPTTAPTRSKQTAAPAPARHAASIQQAQKTKNIETRAVPAPALRQTVPQAAYTNQRAVGDNRFPGLTYPTPSVRSSIHGATASRQGGQKRQTEALGDTAYIPIPPRPSALRRQLRIVPHTYDEAPDTENRVEVEENIAIDRAFADMLASEEQNIVQREQVLFDSQQPAEDVEVDLWETRHGDLEDEISLDQYTTINGLDDTLDGTNLEGEDFDFDQQSIPFAAQAAARVQPKTESLSTDEATPRLVVGIGLDPGLARKDAPNEDSLFAIQGIRVTDAGSCPAGLFVVADGMGGHANGREASRTAIHTLSDVIVPALLRDVSGNTAKQEKTLFQDMLKDGVHRANLAIYRQNREMPRMMGTTLTAALVVGMTAYIANIGDSRTYLYRPSEGLKQISHDHSVVARLVEDGVITRDEIYTHPQRNQIYRCLGEHASVEPDSFVVQLEVNDILMLCSDGLWEMVRDAALEKIIASAARNPGQLSALLIQAALNHGGADNISVVIAGLAGADDAAWML